MKTRIDRPPLLRYLARAFRLRCPTCGVSPVFIALRRLKRIDDWFQPLDGCGRCGYPYEREPGYFLLAIWAFNYGGACIFGLILFSVLANVFELNTKELLVYTLIPTALFAFLGIRRAKATWLAIDLWLDPPERPPKPPHP